MRKKLSDLTAAGTRIDEAGAASFVDLRLSATLMEPLAIPATSPSDEALWRARSVAGFHFRQRPGALDGHSDLAGPRAIARLALAARTTSSFPGAFEAALVRSSRPAGFTATAPAADDAFALEGEAARVVDCHGVFSESRGPSGHAGTTMVADDFAVADGGIVDNIPLGRALDAIASVPAEGPTTRYLVYLHPTGPVPPPPTAPTGPSTPQVAPSRRNTRAVAEGTFHAFIQGETIDGDLEQVERLNRAIRTGRLLREQTHQELFLSLDPLPPSGGQDLDGQADTATPTGVGQEGARARLDGYRIQRAAFDAANLRRLLDDPVFVLGEDPFPHRPGGDDVWLAPLQTWTADQRAEVDAALTRAFAAELAEATADGELGPLLTIGLAPLRRTVGLLLEWVRWHLLTGADKAELYRLAGIVAAMERQRRLAWTVLAATRPPAVDEPAEAWVASALARVDRLRRVTADAADALLDDSVPGPYRTEAAAALQAMVDDSETPVSAVGPDLAALVRDRILTLAGRLLGAVEPGAEEGRVALIGDVLREHPDDLLGGLAALEVLTLPEVLVGAPGREEISFFRISAAARTPLAGDFETLWKVSEDRRGKPRDGWEGQDDVLRPEVKLAGNELANFSAFLDARWRSNDWWWGRLDAAADLVDIVLERHRAGTDPSTEAQLEAMVVGIDAPLVRPDGTVRTPIELLRHRLVARRQRELAEAWFGAGWQEQVRTHGVGLEKVLDGSLPDIGRVTRDLVVVAGHVAEDSAPPAAALAIRAGTRGARIASRYATRPKPPDGPASDIGPVERVKRWILRVVRTYRLRATIALFVAVTVASIASAIAFDTGPRNMDLFIAGYWTLAALLLVVLAAWTWLRRPLPDLKAPPPLPTGPPAGSPQGPKPPPAG